MPKGPVGPGGLSASSYVEKCLRPVDAEHFSAAGVLPFRQVNGGIEVLLAWETPWNSLTQSNDPESWNVFGGKRIPRQERSSDVTAARTFLDTVGIVDGVPETGQLYRLLFDGFVLWYAFGKFALLLCNVTDILPADLPEQYLEARKQTPLEEFKITPTGVKTWVKQIERLEWVPCSSLTPAPRRECSDLLHNILQVEGFRDFLEGRVDPAQAFPSAVDGADGPPALQPHEPRGKDGGKGGKRGGKGKGFGNQGFGKGFGMKGMMPFGIPDGKGGMMAPMAPMPMMYPYQEMQQAQHPSEMQQGLYGEQLYLLVKPLSPSAYLAQKITGMLLELPHNELMMNLKNTDELERRVHEALQLLREDGLCS